MDPCTKPSIVEHNQSIKALKFGSFVVVESQVILKELKSA